MKKFYKIIIIIFAIIVSLFILFIGLGYWIDSTQPTYIGGDEINLEVTSVSPEEISNGKGPYLVKVYIENKGYLLADEIVADANSISLNLNKKSLDLIEGDSYFEWRLNPGSGGYFEVPINPKGVAPGNYSIDLTIHYEDDQTNNFVEYESAVIRIVEQRQ